MKLPAVLLLFALASCVSESEQQARSTEVRNQSLRSGFCTIHHVPLVHATVYQWSSTTSVLDPQDRAQARYPNALPYDMRRELSPQFHDKTVEAYCPICQDRFEQETSNQTMQLTATAPRFENTFDDLLTSTAD